MANGTENGYLAACGFERPVVYGTLRQAFDEAVRWYVKYCEPLPDQHRKFIHDILERDSFSYASFNGTAMDRYGGLYETFSVRAVEVFQRLSEVGARRSQRIAP